ncbi:MAG: cell division FtsZ family protein [Blastocatellales bacterium]|nr:cell division FtsZ family protein [Blastocatellales bacterium]
MATPMIFEFDREFGPQIRIFGAGGAGCNAINRMIETGVKYVRFVAADADAASLDGSLAPAGILINGEDAKQAEEKIRQCLNRTDMVVVAAGLGGGAGARIAQSVASIASQENALTVGVVTTPFSFEGRRRAEAAERSIRSLLAMFDALIVIPGDALLEEIDPATRLSEVYRRADDALCRTIKTITDTITIPGGIEVDFADVRMIMRGMGLAAMGMGRARGNNRAQEAVKRAIESPLLAGKSLRDARSLFVSVTGCMDFTLFELDEMIRAVYQEVNDDAIVVWGCTHEDDSTDEVGITIIALGYQHASGY